MRQEVITVSIINVRMVLLASVTRQVTLVHACRDTLVSIAKRISTNVHLIHVFMVTVLTWLMVTTAFVKKDIQGRIVVKMLTTVISGKFSSTFIFHAVFYSLQFLKYTVLSQADSALGKVVLGGKLCFDQQVQITAYFRINFNQASI